MSESKEPAADLTNTITWRELLAETTQLVGDANEARWLCQEAVGERGDDWLAELDRPATERAVARLDAMVARRRTGEPLAYALGSWAFRTLELIVDRRVLIPRPETEIVVEFALTLARELVVDRGSIVAADLGTGSGAIGLSLAAELPLGSLEELWCTDVSSDALDVCRANLAGLGRRGSPVRVAAGAWFDAIDQDRRGAVDLIVSNPPYVGNDDPDLDASVKDWEPGTALFAGSDGLAAYRSIVEEAPAWLRPGGAIVFEIGYRQAEVVTALCTAAGLVDVVVSSDLAGNDRVVTARLPRGS